MNISQMHTNLRERMFENQKTTLPYMHNLLWKKYYSQHLVSEGQFTMVVRSIFQNHAFIVTDLKNHINNMVRG